MSVLKIKNAINDFNDKQQADDDRLTQGKLGAMIMPELPASTSKYYISMWCHDKALGKLKPEHIVLICEITGVDPNFLYGY